MAQPSLSLPKNRQGVRMSHLSKGDAAQIAAVS
jgi:hypothetical protein